MQPEKKTFAGYLQEARITGDQTTEVMAVMLNISQEEYELLEGGQYPDDETLRRICTLLDWNYYEVQRLLINEMIAPRIKPGSVASTALNDGAANPAISAGAPGKAQPVNPDTLGSRMREVRLTTDQTVSVIAMLLNIDEETYLGLEDGQSPSDELLRRISSVYRWNYHDLLALLRTQHAHSFQPIRVGTPYPEATADLDRLRDLNDELRQIFNQLAPEERIRVLAQIELIRDTMKRDLAAS